MEARLRELETRLEVDGGRLEALESQIKKAELMNATMDARMRELETRLEVDGLPGQARVGELEIEWTRI